MMMFILQSALLLAIAFIIGAIIGCLLRRLFAVPSVAEHSVTTASATPAAASAAAFSASASPAQVEEAAPATSTMDSAVQDRSETATVSVQAKTTDSPAGDRKAPVSKSASGKAAVGKAGVKAVAPKPEAKPKPASASKKAAAKSVIMAVPVKDDLKRIRGIGRQNEAKLNAQGITAFAQIAGWSATDQAAWGERLAFPGRIERENWVAQAKVLAGGGETEFSERVDKGEVATSLGKSGAAASGKAASGKPASAKPASGKPKTGK